MATTIPQLKHQFLTGQIRILNAPLDPPDAWRDAAPKPKTGSLSQKAVDDVLAKANRILRTHNATCFPPILLDHVCAQIDALYWSQTTTAAVLQGSDEDLDGIALDADLCDDATIATLPDTLPNPQDQASPGSRSFTQRSTLESDDLATRFIRARDELVELSGRRAELEQRRDQMNALVAMLRPIVPRDEVDGKAEDIDGELATEVARMRDLLAKVNQRL